MRQDGYHIANRELCKRKIGEASRCLAMGDRGHSPSQRLKHVTSPPDCPRLKCLTARKHQHDQHSGKVFPQQHACHNRDACQQVRSEAAVEQVLQKAENEWHPAEHQHHRKWHVCNAQRRPTKAGRWVEPAECC